MQSTQGMKNAERGAVLILNGEDDAADTIRPRVDAAGGDPAMIHVIDGVRDGSGKRMFSLRTDLRALRDTAVKVGNVKLIIIDPISAYLDGTDSHKNGDVRGLLTPLSELAAELGAAVVAVSHLSKNSNAVAVYRTMGSLAFIAAARAGWGVIQDPDNPEGRLLLPIKQNLGPDAGGLAFSIQSGPDGPVVEWGGPVDVKIDDAMRPDGDGGAAHTEAAAWLEDTLAAGPVAASEIKTRAAADGIATRTLYRAKATLKVASQKSGFGGDGAWTWALPAGGPDA
jgi:putative DNA primase/helicase